jgi:hypothetical protein
MTLKFPVDVFTDALWAADVDMEKGLRKDYSGRGMYGEKCWGFVSDATTLAKVFLHLGVNAGRGSGGVNATMVAGLATRLESDSMGRSVIWYFPGVSFIEGD